MYVASIFCSWVKNIVDGWLLDWLYSLEAIYECYSLMFDEFWCSFDELGIDNDFGRGVLRFNIVVASKDFKKL